MKNLLFVLFIGFVLYFSYSPLVFSQNLNWIKQISGSGTDYVNGMVTDANGNIYTTGTFSGTIDLDPGPGDVPYGPSVGSDIWVAKYTSTGILLWGFGLVGGDDDGSLDIARDNASNIYITGYCGLTTPLDFDPGPGEATPDGRGAFIAKYNTNGVFQWVKTITGPGTPQGYAIEADGAGNVFVSGLFSLSPAGIYDFDPRPNSTYELNSTFGSIFLARYTTNGVITWAKNFGGQFPNVFDMDLDASNNVYVTGMFEGTNIDFKGGPGVSYLSSSTGSAYIVKYTSSGSFTWAKQVSGQNGDVSLACEVDASNNVYVSGSYNTNGSNIFLAKFNSSGTQQIFKSIGGSSSDAGQSLKLDDSGNIFIAGYFRESNVDFNPGGPPVPISVGNPTYADFFLAKYSTSNLNCQWARNVDVQLESLSPEVNALALSNGKIVAAGNFTGSGDFNACITATTFNATTLDGFLAGYEPIITPLEITGPEVLCSFDSYMYTVTNPPAGLTINWSVTPSAQFSPSSGTGTSFSTNSVGGFSGAAVFSASVSGVCPNSGQLSAWAGTRNPISFISVVVDPWLQRIKAKVTPVPDAIGYEWFLDGILYTGPGMNSDYVTMPISNSCSIPDYSIGVKAINACGTSSGHYEIHPNPCYEQEFFYSFYPNPTSETLTIVRNQTLDSTEENVSQDNNNQTMHYYKLYDFTSNLMVQEGIISDNTEIDVSKLNKGSYLLKIQMENGKEEIHHIGVN